MGIVWCGGPGLSASQQVMRYTKFVLAIEPTHQIEKFHAICHADNVQSRKMWTMKPLGRFSLFRNSVFLSLAYLATSLTSLSAAASPLSSIQVLRALNDRKYS